MGMSFRHGLCQTSNDRDDVARGKLLTGANVIAERLALDGKSHADHLRHPDAKPARTWIFNQYHIRRVVRDERFKLYSTGEMYDAEADREETRNLAASTDRSIVAARVRLEQVLRKLPADAAPPFRLLSQSAFKIRTDEREAKK